MGLAVLLPIFLPWLDRCRVKSIRYRGWTYKIALATFAISFLVLGFLGLQPATGGYVTAARVFTILYLAFFILMPFYTKNEKTKPVPTRVTK
jgi:ubiquinol-cytochrome c reductase cytochrome b subunit